MKKRIRFGFIIVAAIVLFDAVTSVVSRALQVDYAKMFWLSFLLYSAAGYFGCKYLDFLTGLGGDLCLGWPTRRLVG